MLGRCGPTLSRLRQAAAPMGGVPFVLELEILCQVLEGLHQGHELRAPDGRPLHLAYRELSPERVLVTRQGACKLIDFGAARPVAFAPGGDFEGRIRNIPPEQLRGEKVDRRADVYAGGVMLWEGVSGKPLWGDRPVEAIAALLARGAVPNLRALDPMFPLGLREICARALHPEPIGRYQTAAEFQTEIRRYMRRHRLRATRSELASFVEPFCSPETTLASPLARQALPAQIAHRPSFTLSMLKPSLTRVSPARPGSPRSRRRLAVATGVLLLGASALTLGRVVRMDADPPAGSGPGIPERLPPALGESTAAASFPADTREAAPASEALGPREQVGQRSRPEQIAPRRPAERRPHPPPRGPRREGRPKIDLANPYDIDPR